MPHCSNYFSLLFPLLRWVVFVLWEKNCTSMCWRKCPQWCQPRRWSLVTMVMRGGVDGESRNSLNWTAVCSRHKRPSTEQGQLSSITTCSDGWRVCIHTPNSFLSSLSFTSFFILLNYTFTYDHHTIKQNMCKRCVRQFPNSLPFWGLMHDDQAVCIYVLFNFFYVHWMCLSARSLDLDLRFWYRVGRYIHMYVV